MDATRFGQIAKELPKLLDRQVQAILGRKFNDLTKEDGPPTKDVGGQFLCCERNSKSFAKLDKVLTVPSVGWVYGHSHASFFS